MTTALITGITGMVGSHLADYLIEQTDWEIVGLARWRGPLDNIELASDRNLVGPPADRFFIDIGVPSASRGCAGAGSRMVGGGKRSACR